LPPFVGNPGYRKIRGSNPERIVQNIRNQDQHHRKEAFQDEPRRILRKYGFEFDERDVWD
jgi:hypothetical protein